MADSQAPPPKKEHRDPFRRNKRVEDNQLKFDYFLRSYDGRLDLLRVQVFNFKPSDDDKSSEWIRVPMKRKTTPLNRVLYWTWSSTQQGSRAWRCFEQNPYYDVALKWIPACAAMLLLFCFPQNIGGETRNNGFYDPVRERDRHYSKAARNSYEDDPRSARAIKRKKELKDSEEHKPLLNSDVEQYPLNPHIAEDHAQRGIARRPRPRTLCFLVENGAPPEEPERMFEVLPGDNGEAEYVFISYTRRTFCVDPGFNAEWAARDRLELLRFAVAATRAAGVPAFWIDFKCVATDNANTDMVGNPSLSNTKGISEDVYRICDVVRGAHSMAAIVGPPCDNKYGAQGESRDWLLLWASRLWVLPELLLAPGEHRIRIYTQAYGVDPEHIVPEKVAKRNLAERSCLDAEDIRQLVDHYEGSVQLSKLELVQLALDCLRRRTTVERTDADLAYALKGLVRRQPQYVDGESGFEAFASLSLANDSQRLLERLICMLPPNPDADWSDMRDEWGMQLWDIEPTCEIAGIVNDRTVLLDGAYGAAIQWSHLETVAFIKRETAFRTIGRIAIRGSPIAFAFGVFFVAATSDVKAGSSGTAESSNPLLIVGAIVLSLSLLVILAAPYMLFNIYLGKFWSTQAWFFGIEGAVHDLGKIERYLFGFSENRLTWSTSGSLLSRHHPNQFEECEADKPETSDIRDATSQTTHNQPQMIPQSTHQANPGAQVGMRVQNGQLDAGNSVPKTNSGDQYDRKVFTLIDTYSMTATMFYAYHPPTTVLICGHEGGMQRAVLCYDWKTQTYCRETVLRMKTLVLERMFRVDRFQFALKREKKKERNETA